MTKKDEVLNILSGLQDSDNKNIRSGIAALLFNYSCTLCTTDDSEGALQICAIINELFTKETNEDNIITLLKTLANLFVVSKNNRTMGNEMDEKSIINDIKDNGNANIKELKDYFGEYAGVTLLNEDGAKRLYSEVNEMIENEEYDQKNIQQNM